MSEDRTWMHRAFPSLSPEEAERLADRCNGISKTMIKLMALQSFSYSAEPGPEEPPLHAQLGRAAFVNRFVLGDEPLPDLVTAEYVRYLLKQDEAGTVKSLLFLIADLSRSYNSTASRRVLAHKRRALVWHFSGGNLSDHTLTKRFRALLDSNLDLCQEFEFSCGANGTEALKLQRQQRAKTIRNLLSEMRESERNGDKPYVLGLDDDFRIRKRVEALIEK